MISGLTCLFLAAVLGQDPQPIPIDTEEDAVPGLPQGNDPPPPLEVNWDLDAAPRETTPTRRRISLAGLWRVGFLQDRDWPMPRSEMGWIEMPGSLIRDNSKIFDVELQPIMGKWRELPLHRYPWACIERHITAPDFWINRQISLNVRGPWANAEVYCFGVPVKGIPFNGGRRFDLTENLAYGGTTQVTLRLRTPLQADAPAAKTSDGKAKDKKKILKEDADVEPPAKADAKDEAKADAKTDAQKSKPQPPAIKPIEEDPDVKAYGKIVPYIGLELTFNVPRVDNVHLARDVESGEIEAEIDLIRPKYMETKEKVHIRELPLKLKLELSDAKTGKLLQTKEEAIGPLPEEVRTVKIRIPHADKKGAAPPAAATQAQVQLRVSLSSEKGEKPFDVTFPITFLSEQLRQVAK